MLLPMATSIPPNADFCVEIDYVKDSPHPSRVFRAMSDLIEALESVDRTLAQSLDIKIEPILLLEDVEAGSIKAWLKQVVESTDDEALKSGDWKKVVGSYLVKGKYLVVDFLNKRTEIKSGSDIEPLEKELLELAEKTDIRRLPIYHPVSRQKLLADVNKINSALEPLTEEDRVSYIAPDGKETKFNLTLSIAPETIDDLLTRETLISPPAPMILKVKKPDFLGDSKWEFRYDNRPVFAKISDEEWLAEYRAGKVPLSPGDALKAEVQSVVKYGFEGDVVATQHNILRVIEIIKPLISDQPQLVQKQIPGLSDLT